MKLHIGNLAKGVTDAELKEAIVPFGEASSVEIVRDRDGSSKGFGFAEFGDDNHARAAITGLDGKEVGGQTVKVSEARPRKGDAARP
ncbi:MAG TPA: RNA-binding protein [Thermoanaerobaculia bacterium]|nr:RNA-binding protein [Thermoanaerobaculia bacterium]